MQPTGDMWPGALCREVPNSDDFWFPTRTGALYRYAKRLCRQCPVQPECLEYAMEHDDHDHWGIWGGLTSRERRALQRKRDEARAQ